MFATTKVLKEAEDACQFFGEMVKSCKDGASEGIRTLDTHVGNVMLYQAELRSLPN